MEMQWSDRQGSRGRKAWLLFVVGDRVVPFEGVSIPGVVAVVGSDYTKDGKWSHTTFRLRHGAGVRPIPGLDGWESGTFAEGLASAVSAPATPATWPEMAEALGVSIAAAQEFLRFWRPKAADKIDEAEAAIAAVDDAAPEGATVSTIAVSFGSPTNRMIAAGWWTEPQPVPGCDGVELVLRDPGRGWGHADNIEVRGAVGRVLSTVHSAGMHGGYYTVTVAIA